MKKGLPTHLRLIIPFPVPYVQFICLQIVVSTSRVYIKRKKAYLEIHLRLIVPFPVPYVQVYLLVNNC
jgi:hypothetical protein